VNLPRRVRAQEWELERLLAGDEHGGLALPGPLNGAAGDAVSPAIEAAPATDVVTTDIALCDPARALSGQLDGASDDAVSPAVEQAPSTDANAIEVAPFVPASCHEEHEGYVCRAFRHSYGAHMS
jgi:hypothetical protein